MVKEVTQWEKILWAPLVTLYSNSRYTESASVVAERLPRSYLCVRAKHSSVFQNILKIAVFVLKCFLPLSGASLSLCVVGLCTEVGIEFGSIICVNLRLQSVNRRSRVVGSLHRVWGFPDLNLGACSADGRDGIWKMHWKENWAFVMYGEIILPRVLVIKDMVLIGVSIYWIFPSRKYKYL